MVSCLVRVCKTAHTRHHAENVVVRGVDVDSGGSGRADRVVGHRQEESGVINAGQVARARGLVLLGLEREGVDVDTNRGDVGVVLVRLDLVEVAALTNLEAVVAVELEERGDNRVATSHALKAGDGVARLEDGAVPPVREVEGLLALPGVDDGVIARHEGVALDNPHKLLARVVEVELELVGGGRDGLTASELEGLNQILVSHLGELAALISVEVDVVHVEGRSREVRGVDAVADGVEVGRNLRGDFPAEVAEVVELQVDAHLVVLEGDEGEREARVAAEPELEGDVESVVRRAVEDLRGRVGLAAGAVIVARLAALNEEVGELGDVTHHLGVAGLLASLLGELIPDVEPLTVVLVNALTANLELNGLDEVVANPVEPAELSTRAVRGEELNLGESGLEVDAVNQVTVALDSAGHTLAEARGAVERVLNGLHGEVGVAAVNRLEESNLGVTGEVNVLGAIRDELHQATTCHFISLTQKKF